MTNKEVNEDPSCDTQLAGLLAVHLVSQVLDEASAIVNAAKDSGQPWKYISRLKKLRNYRLNETYDEGLTFVVSKEDSRYEYQNQDHVITSTPQKTENKNAKCRNEANFMGQGDEELEVRNYELHKSTSMFINHLFDMSDVEHAVVTDESDIIQNRNTTSEELLIETKLNTFKSEQSFETQPNTNDYSISENSSYSFLNDALCTKFPEDLKYFKSDDESNQNKILDDVGNSTNKEFTCILNETIKQMDNNDLALYENAFLTMNRDDEQYSEEEPVLQDLKEISLQDVELIAIDTSNNDVTPRRDVNKLNATSGLSACGTGSRKSNIVRRCRNQGARLLSCLRGWWWRRKLLGKRKESHVHGLVRGLCPLSPDVRRRASSLLDQRNLRTPSPSKYGVWKFNTVNEALVNSSRWKNFGPKLSLNENDDF